jgi:outer membrane protein OmpA-like peptidoglycan-associated protein
MASPSDDEQLGLVLGLLLGLIAFVIALVVGVAVLRSGGNAAAVPSAPAPVVAPSEPPPAPVAAPVPPASTPLSAQAASDAASITVEYGVVKFYFASGSADLAGGAADALDDVVKGARGGKKVVISGFHDARGNAARNAELARKRAMTVRDALLAAGVADSRIQLEKPAIAAGTGSDAEARRVEIALQ